MSLQEIGNKLNLTRQSIYLAIRSGKLKALKTKKKWILTKKDIDNYFNSKYVRKNKCREGEISVSQASKLLNVRLGKIYYLLYRNKFEYEKRGGAIFIKHKSIL